MNRRGVAWLYSELPGLVSAGVLSEDAAARVRAHYGAVPELPKARWAMLLFGVLGAALIGSGIILLLASNWEQLSRPMRAGIAMLPMLVGQALVGYTLWRKGESPAWREGSAVFLTFAIGACMALIGQTYHLPADLAGFYVTWCVLGWPLIYLLNSSAAAVLFLGGALLWMFEQGDSGRMGLWLYVAAVLPHIVLTLKQDHQSPRSTLLVTAGAVFVTVVLGFLLGHVRPGIWILAYSGLFGVFTLAGERWYGGRWAHPLPRGGTLGTLVLAFVFTYSGVWTEAVRDSHDKVAAWVALQDYVLVVGLPLASVALLVLAWPRMGLPGRALGVFAPLAAAAYVAVEMAVPAALPMLVFNLYVFGLGLAFLVAGLRRGRLTTANAGMVVIAVLAMLRFVDADLNFLVRGVLFIVLGIGFLMANLVLTRRMARDGEGAS